MAFTKECCTRQPIHSNYSPKGSNTELGDLNIYETIDKSPKRLLILVYDIFGLTPNPKQFADIVGTTGFRVIVPDFFRVVPPWNKDNFPPKSMDDLKTWVMKVGSWDKVVKPDLLNIIEHYKKDGVTSFGIFGFCFGGKVSTLASCEIPEIKGAGLIHPSMVETKEANDVKSPILLIPTKDEPDFLPFEKIVKERLGEDSCEHVRFDDMFHGYAGARGDFTNELNRKRVDETIELLVKFFNKHIPE